jgi:enamine deaminase RidA (YjgF/YER057c/UK114 family)
MNRVYSGSPFEKLASYSRAARIGDVVAVAGTAATDETGAALHPGDAGAQTRAAFAIALEGAAKLGARREDVIRTRIFLLPDTDWRAAVEAHGELFRGVDPVNTTLMIAQLIPAGCLVEIEVDAIASGPVVGG